MGYYLFMFWDTELEDYIYYLVESNELDRKNSLELESIRLRIQDTLNRQYFEDLEELYSWLDKNITTFIPDAKPIDFTII